MVFYVEDHVICKQSKGELLKQDNKKHRTLKKHFIVSALNLRTFIPFYTIEKNERQVTNWKKFQRTHYLQIIRVHNT